MFVSSRAERGGMSSRAGPRYQTTREHRDELGRQFFAAAEEGDLAGLEALLADDVALRADGGGKVPALARSMHGRTRVARMLMDRYRLITGVPGVHIRPVEVNGSPGTLVLDEQDRLISVWVLEIGRSHVHSISSIVNPDKLTHLGPTGDLGSLLRRRASDN